MLEVVIPYVLSITVWRCNDVIFISSVPLYNVSGTNRSITMKKDVNICIDVMNPLSGEETREKVVIDPTELIEDENSKEPPYHFGLSWEGSKKKSVLTVLDADSLKATLKKTSKKGKKAKGGGEDPRMPRAYTSDDNEAFVPILALECRGLEPYAFHPMGGEFLVESEGGMVFEGEDVDLSEGDWADYDGDNDISVSISDFESKFEAA